MSTNILTSIGNALTQMYSAQGGFFYATGLNIFWSIVFINVFLLGLDSFAGELTQGHFIRKVGMILVVGSLMGFYTAPLPGVGVSFPHLIIDEAKTLSDQLESNAETLSQDKLNVAIANTEKPNSGIVPTISNFIAAFWYLCLIILVALEKLWLIGILAVSYIAIGVITLVGPMFLPWALFPGLESLAWNWFFALMQYCFYQVVAGAVVFLNSIVLFGFFNQHPYPWKLDDLPTIVTEFVIMLGVSIYIVTWVPSIASSVVGGPGLSAVKARVI